MAIRLCSVLLLASLVAASPSAARANGAVAGVVRTDRVPPRSPPTTIAKDVPVCGREAAPEAPRVAANRGLANVVVWIKGLVPKTPPSPTPGATIDQVACRYIPHVQAVTIGSRLTLLNSDAVLHNVHAIVAAGNSQVTVFNVAMPFKGQKLPATVKRPGVMKVRCDAGHTWMSAYVHAFDHPYFAVTDDQGSFTIKDVPAGQYTLEYWHEPVGARDVPLTHSAPVRVVTGETARADLMLSL